MHNLTWGFNGRISPNTHGLIWIFSSDIPIRALFYDTAHIFTFKTRQRFNGPNDVSVLMLIHAIMLDKQILFVKRMSAYIKQMSAYKR